MTVGICSLCGNQNDLMISHIIPKFVGNWLKETSGTGFLRGITTPEYRLQDLMKLPLLCTTCEQRFSKLETYFADKIFYPFHKKQERTFDYDERLEQFVVSLSWRTLKMSYKDLGKDPLTSFVDKAEQDWRDYLLGKKNNCGPYENHIIFLDYVSEEVGLPEKAQWYTLRAVDGTLSGNDKRIFAYTKFPWMVLVTSIYPQFLEGWEETKIKQSEKISSPQKIRDGEFGNFLIERAKLSVQPTSSAVSTDINKKILASIKKNPEKYLESASFDVAIIEQDRTRRAKMKDMPELVRGLVDEIILKIAEDPSVSKLENQLTKMNTRKIADIISDLSAEEISMLDSKIQFAIRESNRTLSDIQVTLEVKDAWITFMVNPLSTKEHQQSKIIKEIERIKSQTTEKPIVVFSMNPSYEGPSFETGFILSF